MDRADKAIRYNLGGREVALLLNARAWRLIEEHTGFDILAMAIDLSKSDDPVKTALGMIIKAKVLPRVIWAATQTEDNGPESEWPLFQFVEENLVFVNLGPCLQALLKGLFTTAEGSAERGNEQAKVNGLAGLTSGPSEPAPTVSASPSTDSGSQP